MKIKFKQSIKDYEEFILDFSKVTPSGKRFRKRFMIGFHMMYILLIVGVFILAVIRNLLFDPFLIMLGIIYIVLMVFMKYVDIVGQGYIRQSMKMVDLSNFDIEKIFKWDGKSLKVVGNSLPTQSYNIEDIEMIRETNRLMIIYMKNIESIYINKSFLSESEIEKIKTLYSK